MDDGIDWEMVDEGSDDSGMETILDGEVEEEPQPEHKRGMFAY